MPDWIQTGTASDDNYFKLLNSSLDAGEASAIALAFAFRDVILILDDLKARKEAKRLGFRVTGTLGVILAAKHRGVIPAVKPYLDVLLLSGFRISPLVVAELLEQSGEI